jgi:hypothetical protein
MTKYVNHQQSGITVVYGYDPYTGFYYIIHDPKKVSDENVDGIIEIKSTLYDKLTGQQLAKRLLHYGAVDEKHPHYIQCMEGMGI